MRKTLISLTIVLFGLTNLFAQEEKSFGPTAGNFAIGFSSEPVWEYIGNFFGKLNNNSAPSATLSSGQGIFGKYFSAENRAIRAGVYLNFQSVTDKWPEAVWEKTTSKDFGLSVSLGLENRIGQGRLQAFYGPSAGMGFSSSSLSYSYDGAPPSGSVHKITSGNVFSIAAGIFGGVEYFLSPKIALGTELGFGLVFLTRGTGSIERHFMDDEPYEVGRNGFYMGFERNPAQMAPRGSIYITLYL